LLGIAKLGFPPQYQGKGLGKKLLEAFVEEARRRHLNIGVASAEGPFFTMQNFSA
jgi:GNAT superfamily N-acetyltransferase